MKQFTPSESGVPEDVQAEQALLGTIMKRNDELTAVAALITSDVFYKSAHAHIYREMVELTSNGRPIDEITIGDGLREKKLLEECGNYAYLNELLYVSPESGNATEYAKIIQAHFMSRRLMQVSLEVSRKSRDPSTDIGTLLQEAEQKLAEISTLSIRKPYFEIGEVLISGMRKLKEVSEAAKRGEQVTGLATGFGKLDDITSGLQKSDLIIIAARPSMGKTALALNMARHAIRDDGACLFFSMEMSKDQLALRLLSAEAEVDTKLMRSGKLEDDDWSKLSHALEHISRLNFYVNDQPGLKTFDLVSIARQLNQELTSGLSLVVVDYLQLMYSSIKTQNREQEISDISRTLKNLAKDLNVPVIALSQLNRAVENRVTKIPVMADLRESGSLEQDADIVMFIYRDVVYNKESPPTKAELIIGKHRNGATATISMAFFSKYTKFANPSPLEEAPPPGIE